MRPLIGVTTSEVRSPERATPVPEGEPRVRELALGLTYMRAVEAAGGLPLVIPLMDEDAIEPLLDRLDGVCLSGGPDIHPGNYGADPHAELGPTEPTLDSFELGVARRADVREMPILAICRGTQALNVVRGGVLHQHLPEVSEVIPHRQITPGTETSHAVEIVPGSRLARALGYEELRVADALDVNSFHHQAIDRLGDGLEVTARAPDGTIEAIEDPNREFLIGVQWHAETLVHRPYEKSLFASFVEACGRQGDAGLRDRSGREVA
ncbi:MAG TPA: gamma-glutamyl-gamma-aminobutyrate hydrolase family protein [Solirubrobacterales bacterium]|nr:gamma-glutamyl-gamma-aminobutyrate hydrolase family protein [Solirubrobacterales bacterium]